MMRNYRFSLGGKLRISLIVLAVLAVLAIIGWFWIGGYVFHGVGSTEVGVKFRSNEIVEIVGPGIYFDFAPFANLRNVDASGIPFQVSDEEVLTKDKQRIGVVVTGTVHRPGLARTKVLKDNWSQYSRFYTSNEILAGREVVTKDKDGKETKVWQGGLMESLGQQAQKVCVGDLNFDDAVIGSARDDLRVCVDKQLGILAGGYGLEVKNIVVPQITLSPAVQKKLDEITQARFETQVANQLKLKADAEGERELAVQQAAIRVEQGKIQEKSKQDAITADLNKAALVKQRDVIAQQKSNDLFTAEQDLAIQLKQMQVAVAKAQVDLANQAALAEIYQNNPNYTNIKLAEAYSAAYKATDKVIIPQGSDPYLFLGNQPGVIATPTRQ